MPSPRLALAAVGAAQAAPALSAHCGALGSRLGIVHHAGAASAIALTFDDGPHPEATPRVLELLAVAGAPATFFLVGEQVRRHPQLAARIAAAGHAVGLHGDTHRCELRLSPRALARDRARGRAQIEQVTGAGCVGVRPPYGAVSGTGLLHARRIGLPTILWSRWGRDWRSQATGEGVSATVLGRAGLREHEIVLLHDADHYGAPGCWRATVAALPLILDAACVRGLVPVRL